MARCQLKIELDHKDRIFNVGDTVSGRVFVDVDKTTQVDELELGFYWKTHGHGDTDQGEPTTQNLFNGEWQPGNYDYDFSFVLTEKKYSYHGEIINLDWYIEVAADVPWAIDPSDQIDILVLPNSATDNTSFTPQVPPSKPGSSVGTASWGKILAVVSALMLFVGAYIVLGMDSASRPQILMPVFNFLDANEIDYAWIGKTNVLFFIVPIFILFGLGKLGWWFYQQIKIEKMLDDLELLIARPSVSTLQPIDATLSFTPTQNVEFEMCVAHLICEESATSSNGTTSSTYRRIVYQDSQNLPITGSRHQGVPVAQSFGFTLPPNAPATLDLSDNEINWTVKVEFVLNNSLCWDDERKVIVSHEA